MLKAKLDLIGIGSTYFKAASLLHQTCERIKELRSNVILVGGSKYATDALELMLHDPNVDCIIISEGEGLFMQFVRIIGQGGDITSILGVGFRGEDGQISVSSYRFLGKTDLLP